MYFVCNSLHFYVCKWDRIMGKCQVLVVSLTIYTEFIVCYTTTIEVIWLKNYISELRVVDFITRSFVIYYNNNTIMFFCKNYKASNKSIHIKIKYFIIRDIVKNGDIIV